MCKFENKSSSPTRQRHQAAPLFSFKHYFKRVCNFLKRLFYFRGPTDIQDGTMNNKTNKRRFSCFSQMNNSPQRINLKKASQKLNFMERISIIERQRQKRKQNKNKNQIRGRANVGNKKIKKERNEKNHYKENIVQQSGQQQNVINQKQELLKYLYHSPKSQQKRKKYGKSRIRNSIRQQIQKQMQQKRNQGNDETKNIQTRHRISISQDKKIQMINEAVSIINEQEGKIRISIQQQIQGNPTTFGQRLQHKLLKINSNISQRNERLRVQYEQAKSELLQSKRVIRYFDIASIEDIIHKPPPPIISQRPLYSTILDKALAPIRQRRDGKAASAQAVIELQAPASQPITCPANFMACINQQPKDTQDKITQVKAIKSQGNPFLASHIGTLKLQQVLKNCKLPTSSLFKIPPASENNPQEINISQPQIVQQKQKFDPIINIFSLKAKQIDAIDYFQTSVTKPTISIFANAEPGGDSRKNKNQKDKRGTRQLRIS